MTIDTYPVMSVAEAHDAWRSARDQVRAGRDPARKECEERQTSKACSRSGWHAIRPGISQRVSDANSKGRASLLGQSTDRHDRQARCSRYIDAIVDRGAATQASSVHAYLHRLFKWAVGRGIIDRNPVANLPKPGAGHKARRVLSDDELVDMERGERVRLSIRDTFSVIYRCWTEEIGQLRWAEIDSDTVTLADDRTKTSMPTSYRCRNLPARSSKPCRIFWKSNCIHP